MFGIGTGELLIILLIALLVLGPKEIPRVARTLARTLRSLQRVTDDIKHTVTAEIEELEEAEKKPLATTNVAPHQEQKPQASGEGDSGDDSQESKAQENQDSKTEEAQPKTPD